MIKIIMSIALLFSINLLANAVHDHSSHGHSHQGTKEGTDAKIEAYAKACDEGDIKSCNNLAVLYDLGDVVKQDKKKAIKLYTKACNGGNKYSCNTLEIYILKMILQHKTELKQLSSTLKLVTLEITAVVIT